MSNLLIETMIQQAEYNLARLKAVQIEFPTAKYHGDGTFSDKKVNKLYTHFKFQKSYDTLLVIPYYQISFSFNNKEETITIYSQPRRNKLAKVSWYSDANNKRTMSFSRLSVNMKNNKFKEDMLNSCKAEIMNFIRLYPNCNLDTKHLEPRLQKLLAFT